MKKIIFTLLLIAASWQFLTTKSPVTLGPGIFVNEVPFQKAIHPHTSFTLDNFTITKKFEFQIKAKVIAMKNYYFDRQSDISKTDFGLGWGAMSDESMINQFEFSQSNRFMWWNAETWPRSKQEIQNQLTNAHLIPATTAVEHDIDSVRQGDIIVISGYLVNVNENNSRWYWNSSESRTDTGDGACEIIWVESLKIVTPLTL
ncbi:hypothetical protein [Photobacterium nomapromontoriensis]|uniref:hypothetical protein n=1 Tax=Photobacterium nomapromontoriensis TaxID=2910237 RepID=UPI003D12F1B0